MLNQIFKTSGYTLGYFLLSLLLGTALALFMSGLIVLYPLFLVLLGKEVNESDTWLNLKIPLFFVLAFIPLLLVSLLLYLTVLSQLVIIPFALLICGIKDSFEEEETFLSAFDIRVKALFSFYLGPLKNLKENQNAEINPKNQQRTLLTEEELKKAAALFNDSPNHPKLPKRITRYTTLLAQLQQLDKAIIERDQRLTSLTHFNPTVPYVYDQNNPSQTTQITLPGLFFKQFQKNDQWKVVPGSTKICDAQKIHTYTLFRNSNPFDVTESLSRPKAYKNYPSRYHCSLYKGEAEELLEAAEKIRKMI